MIFALIIVLFIFGVLCVVGAAGDGLLLFLGVCSVVIGLALLFIDDSKTTNREHVAMVKDLRTEGWDIKSSDIHADSNEMIFRCGEFKLFFDLIKVKEHWVVAVKRSKTLGGGYNIVKPRIQDKLRRACS